MSAKDKDLKNKPSLPWWTWVLPLLIFHFGTGLSLNFQISQRMSLWYLPVPLGLFLIHWWGPRVLLGLYLNALLCAGYWGFNHWWFWPLYALPETLKVGLSWLLFTRILKGKVWLPDLSNMWRFLLFGMITPCFLGSVFGEALFIVLGDFHPEHWWHEAYVQFVLDILCPFAITVPALLFATAYIEKFKLSMTQGAYPCSALVLSGRITRLMMYEVIALFSGLLILSLCVSLETYWFVYGVFLIWGALRFGIGVASIGTIWTICLAILFPALLSNHFASLWLTRSDLLKVNLNLATLCFAALVVGRALSDVFQEIETRKQAESSLKISENKYRLLFESASDAIILGDKGIIFDCNKRALEMLGAKLEDIIGSHSSRFFQSQLPDGSDAVTVMSKLRSEALDGHPQFFEWKVKRLDGSLINTEITFRGVDLDGKRIIMAVIHDITQRKKMERAVFESEYRHRTLFESANDAIVVSENGLILDCNHRTTELFGFTREQMIGFPATMGFPDFQPNGVRTADLVLSHRLAALEGTPQSYELLQKKADGSTFETETTLAPVILEGRRIIQVVIRDISQRKKIERALVESEERFRQMAENIQEIFFLLDKATQTMLYVSPIAESLLGVPLENVINRPLAIDERMHPEDRERVGFFKDGAWYKRTFNEDFRFIRPDGVTRWLRMRTFLIPDNEGRIYRVAGVATDITEYKTAQEETRNHQQKLVQADKMNSLGQMVSGVAHEINNPNNLIMLNADVMDTFWKHLRPALRDYFARYPDWKLANIPYDKAEGKYETLLQGITGGAKRIKNIVDNLKDFARVNHGDLSESIVIEKVIAASIGIVDHLIRKSTNHFQVLNGENIPPILGNFQKLEQVIINLITNACQALASSSHAIRIETWFDKENERVGIRVEDEGIGIPENFLRMVTDPFFTTKRDSGGTGLGLSVSYGIIREHKGTLEIQSQENHGTKVEIMLPARNPKL